MTIDQVGADTPTRRGAETALSALVAGVVVICAFVAVASFHHWPGRAVVVTLCLGLIVVAVVDLRQHRIPNSVVGLQSISLLAASLAAVSVTGPGPIERGLAAGIVSFGVFVVLRIVAPRGIGMGDVKEALPLGFALGWIGWAAVVVGLALAFVVNGIACAAVLITRRGDRATLVPFGPSMAVGTALTLLMLA